VTVIDSYAKDPPRFPGGSFILEKSGIENCIRKEVDLLTNQFLLVKNLSYESFVPFRACFGYIEAMSYAKSLLCLNAPFASHG